MTTGLGELRGQKGVTLNDKGAGTAVSKAVRKPRTEYILDVGGDVEQTGEADLDGSRGWAAYGGAAKGKAEPRRLAPDVQGQPLNCTPSTDHRAVWPTATWASRVFFWFPWSPLTAYPRHSSCRTRFSSHDPVAVRPYRHWPR